MRKNKLKKYKKKYFNPHKRSDGRKIPSTKTAESIMDWTKTSLPWNNKAGINNESINVNTNQPTYSPYSSDSNTTNISCGELQQPICMRFHDAYPSCGIDCANEDPQNQWFSGDLYEYTIWCREEQHQGGFQWNTFQSCNPPLTTTTCTAIEMYPCLSAGCINTSYWSEMNNPYAADCGFLYSDFSLSADETNSVAYSMMSYRAVCSDGSTKLIYWSSFHELSELQGMTSGMSYDTWPYGQDITGHDLCSIDGDVNIVSSPDYDHEYSVSDELSLALYYVGKGQSYELCGQTVTTIGEVRLTWINNC